MKSIDHRQLLVEPGSNVNLADLDPGATHGFKHKDDASEKLSADIERLYELQEVFYASGQHALLIVLQGTDSAGKDGAIKHVMTGVNPQGADVHSFKVPSATELSHDYLWRTTKVLPERGRIGIFNRSYYAEVVVVRIHRAVLENEKLPPGSDADSALWKERYEDINAFERHMSRNGTLVIKFFLHLSKNEQRKRLLDRVDSPDKQWKLSAGDIHERKYWDDYQRAYAESLSNTSTQWAPWYVIPADHKWFARLAIASVIVAKLESLDLQVPVVTDQQREYFAEIRKELSSPGERECAGADRRQH